MRIHIKRFRKSYIEKVKFILTKCEVLQRENYGYLDPGPYIFEGGRINGASSPAVTTATHDHQEAEDSPAGEAVTLKDRGAEGSDPQEAETSSKKRTPKTANHRDSDDLAKSTFPLPTKPS